MFNMKKTVVVSAIVATLVGFGSLAEAATISLSPGHQDVAPGSAVSVVLGFDFTGGTSVLGGGVDVFYNSSVLDFVSFTYNPALAIDPDFSRVPDDMSGEVNGISFGNFGGLSGTGVVGTLQFKALALGETPLTMADNNSPAGPFFDVAAKQVTMNYQNAHVNVVPIPAAVWLFGSGLAGLGLFRTRRRARS
ncbi:MAG: VPLPA-CTERM sorting domain-containing protein [Sulfuricaulis sp.]|nr:VPLPA-CTERM sorting domain-containing protein [Sulfuricaulis sp.]